MLFRILLITIVISGNVFASDDDQPLSFKSGTYKPLFTSAHWSPGETKLPVDYCHFVPAIIEPSASRVHFILASNSSALQTEGLWCFSDRTQTAFRLPIRVKSDFVISPGLALGKDFRTGYRLKGFTGQSFSELLGTYTGITGQLRILAALSSSYLKHSGLTMYEINPLRGYGLVSRPRSFCIG